MRLNYDDDDKVEVQMSPLIDCVFLLLIFFLVEVTAYRTVPVSTVIEIFDQCQIQGFTHTRVRLGSKPY